MLTYTIFAGDIDPKAFIEILKFLEKCGHTNWDNSKKGWIGSYKIEKEHSDNVNLTVSVDLNAFNREDYFSINLSWEENQEEKRKLNEKIDGYIKQLTQLNKLLGIS